MRKEVIANVSHELRSPLALNRGYGEMVRDISWSNDEKRREHLNLIIDESNRLSQMVKDIMDYSQIQSGYLQLNREAVHLMDIIHKEVDHYKKTASAYGIDIKIDNQVIVLRIAKQEQAIRLSVVNNPILEGWNTKIVTVSP